MDRKLAFCFLIYDTLNHTDLWEAFFTQAPPSLYRIHIHYKTHQPLEYFEGYRIKDCVPTQYAHVSLVKAQNRLMEEALKDPTVSHVIFVSNSCVPFKRFDQVYHHLVPRRSYFNVTPQSQCFPRCTPTLQWVQEAHIQKSSQWCILAAPHAQQLLQDRSYLTWFDYEGGVPDEHCYITFMHVNGLQDELITTPNLAEGATTFTNWEGMNYRFPNHWGIKNYLRISEEETSHLIESPCLFGRKFDPHCDLQSLLQFHRTEFYKEVKSAAVPKKEITMWINLVFFFGIILIFVLIYFMFRR